MNKKTNNKGFSLVELIIVIAIMAILIGVLAPQFIKYVQKSRISKDLQNAQELKTAIEVYAAGSEGLSDDITVSISAKTATDPAKITAKLGSTDMTSTQLTGVTVPVNLSAEWPAGSFKFDKSSYTWSTTTDSTLTHDSKTYKMSDVY